MVITEEENKIFLQRAVDFVSGRMSENGKGVESDNTRAASYDPKEIGKLPQPSRAMVFGKRNGVRGDQ